MLARPEIGTREHIKLWSGSKDPKELYNWSSSRDCACGQYCREHMNADYNWINDPQLAPAIAELNTIAAHVPVDSTSAPYTARVRTFGALHAALMSAWQ